MDELFNNVLNIFINTNEHTRNTYRRPRPQNIYSTTFNNMFDSFVDEINSTPLTRSSPVLYEMDQVYENHVNRRYSYEDLEDPDDIEDPGDAGYENDYSFRLNQNILHNTRILRQLLQNADTTPVIDTNRQEPFDVQLDLNQRLTSEIQTRLDIIYGQFGPQIDTIQAELDNRGSGVRNLFSENLLNLLMGGLNSQPEFGDLENQISSFEDIKITLSGEEFDKIIKLEEDIEGVCNICLDDLCIEEPKDIIVSLHCKHFYHKNCINKWLTQQSTKCPVCRYDCRDNCIKN
jgi:hypothetical protein